MMGGAGWGALAQLGTDIMNVGHSAIQNRKARRFAEHMTKLVGQNQISWRMADMRRAGLNPILAAGGPGAPMASAPQIGGAARGGIAASARQSKELKSVDLQQRLLREQIRAAANEVQRSHHGVFSEMASSSAREYQALQERERWAMMQMQREAMGLEMPRKRAVGKYYSEQEGRYIPMPVWSQTIRDFLGDRNAPLRRPARP